MSRTILVFFALFCISDLYAQGTSEAKPKPSLNEIINQQINPESLRQHLTILASDEFEGRETGQPGQKKAAAYITRVFEEMGIPPIASLNGYQQKISFFKEKWEEIALALNGNDYRHLYDFYGFPATNSSQSEIKTGKIYFAGYGIDDPAYSDFKGSKWKGKVILIYDGEPQGSDGNFLISGNSQASEWGSDFRKKLIAAKKYGVKAVLIIDPAIQKNIADNRNKILGGGSQMGMLENRDQIYPNNLFISPSLAKQIIGTEMPRVVDARENIQKGLKYKRVKIRAKTSLIMEKSESLLEGENVLGFVEGTDPDKKQELIVVTAHYDHLGKRGESIFNGADDNGTGTSTVLTIAKSLQEAKNAGLGPKRSVLCMLVSGEEKGLLGSKYYVNYPVFPLENTVANVNVDMIGRVDKKHQDNPEYIYVIGADKLSSELHEINENANSTYTQLDLDYTYNDINDPNRYYYRSDHYNFAERGIPAIFYFSGTHEDYHRPSDTVDKIEFNKMAKIGKLVFHTTWELANRPDRIAVDKKG